jgi:hypothetical protein
MKLLMKFSPLPNNVYYGVEKPHFVLVEVWNKQELHCQLTYVWCESVYKETPLSD